MNQEELTVELNDVKDRVVKIGTETESLLQKVNDLQVALENAGNITPEVQAALDALKTQAQAVDDLVPDQP